MEVIILVVYESENNEAHDHAATSNESVHLHPYVALAYIVIEVCIGILIMYKCNYLFWITCS